MNETFLGALCIIYVCGGFLTTAMVLNRMMMLEIRSKVILKRHGHIRIGSGNVHTDYAALMWHLFRMAAMRFPLILVWPCILFDVFKQKRLFAFTTDPPIEDPGNAVFPVQDFIG